MRRSPSELSAPPCARRDLRKRLFGRYKKRRDDDDDDGGDRRRRDRSRSPRDRGDRRGRCAPLASGSPRPGRARGLTLSSASSPRDSCE